MDGRRDGWMSHEGYGAERTCGDSTVAARCRSHRGSASEDQSMSGPCYACQRARGTMSPRQCIHNWFLPRSVYYKDGSYRWDEDIEEAGGGSTLLLSLSPSLSPYTALSSFVLSQTESENKTNQGLFRRSSALPGWV